MDRRQPHDEDEKVELNTYRYQSNNVSFDQEPFAPSPISPRALTPVRPGHFPTDEYGQPVWLQPTARMSGHSDSINGSPWNTQTPYDSRSGSPTLVNHVLSNSNFLLCVRVAVQILTISNSTRVVCKKVTRVSPRW